MKFGALVCTCSGGTFSVDVVDELSAAHKAGDHISVPAASAKNGLMKFFTVLFLPSNTVIAFGGTKVRESWLTLILTVDISRD